MKIAVILAGSALVCSALPARAGVDAFRDGQADRASYEAWFGALSGDMRSGAEYWAGQRSLKNPGSCYSASGQPIAGWTSGCKAGQQQLALSDARRKSEPEYRAGWNSLPASTQPGATEPSSHAQMANADCSTAASSTGYYSPASALQVIRDCEYRRDEARRAIESERFAGEMRARQAAEDVARVERDDRDRRERVRAAEVARLREAAFETEAAQAAADKIREQEREKAKLVAAETSPDNNCRKPKFAGDMMRAIDDLKAFKANEVRVIDVEHLITKKWDSDTLDIVCHGVFVFDNETRVAATFETKPNVAGDVLTRWVPDPKQ